MTTSEVTSWRELSDEEDEEEDEDEEEEGEEEGPKVLLFTEKSIVNLAESVGEKCMMLAMYLNIPTTTIVYMNNAAVSERRDLFLLNKNILMYWATLRSASSDKAKAKELVKALAACGLEKIADSVMPALESNQMFKSMAQWDEENYDDDEENDDSEG